MSKKANIEKQRLALQAALDAEKTQGERNRMGQFATPTALAQEVLRHAVGLLPPRDKISFLDPAIGTGAFYSALLSAAPKSRVTKAMGFEIDPHYGKPAEKLWKASGLALKLSDFTHAIPDSRFNLVICNPPYVRHHHLQIGDKTRLQLRTQEASGIKLSGLAGLYCHFLGLSHAWMTKGGIGVWLIPSEFMDVNYGLAVKRYLLDCVTLLHVHRFDPNDVQFADALVSSAVVCFKNEAPPKNHEVTFTFGGSLCAPHTNRRVPAVALRDEPKWTRFPVSDVRKRSGAPTLSDFFKVKRGIATGDNGYFILSEDEIARRGLPMEVFTPILPSPRYLPTDEIKARPDGTPDIERRLFLLDTKLPEDEIGEYSPALYAYLQEGKAQGLHERYLCKHRALWYAQENRPAAPIVCTYLGRGDAKSGRPFRFIRNDSRATVANVFLAMYPTPFLDRALARDKNLLPRVWKILNELTPEELLGEGRVYGGGLHKLEPRELANVPVPKLAALLPSSERPAKQAELLTELVA
jgi:hypothetical protein